MKTRQPITLYIVVIVFLLSVVFAQYAHNRAQSRVLHILADDIGYVCELAEYSFCWDKNPMSCGRVLYLNTSMNSDELQSKIDALLGENVLPQEVSIYTLLNINLSTEHVITIDALDASKRTPLLELSLAHQWKSGDWVITLYEFEGSNLVYNFDGVRIYGNVATIMLRSK